LVEGRDLVVSRGYVYMRTTKGLERVDVIYRRVDDDFLDPETFRADSLLGVPGLMAAYRAGRVALANAPGNGVADDKVIYAYVPDMIRYYEGEDPILPNVPTYLCWRDADRQHVLGNLEHLVVKAANESGGDGKVGGPPGTAPARGEVAGLIQADPLGRRRAFLFRRPAMIAASQTKPLLSRVADSVYWMGRYTERAENVARFLDVNHNLMLDLPQGYQDQWQPIVDTTGDRALFAQRYGTAKRESVVKFLAFDPDYPN